MRQAGRHFLQIPGPSAVPDRILKAIGQQTNEILKSEFHQSATAQKQIQQGQ